MSIQIHLSYTTVCTLYRKYSLTYLNKCITQIIWQKSRTCFLIILKEKIHNFHRILHKVCSKVITITISEILL